MSSSIRSESNRDSVDEVSGAPSNVRFENQPSNPINPTSPTSESDVNTTGSGCGDYPEQKHAGAVGYGPNYVDRVELGEKLQGIKEQVKGKITRNPDLVERGHSRQTGELKKREEEEENDKNPFATPEDKKP